MSERTESGMNLLFLEGYVESRIAKGEKRQHRYPENGLPAVNVKSKRVESTMVVALRTAAEQQR